MPINSCESPSCRKGPSKRLPAFESNGVEDGKVFQELEKFVADPKEGTYVHDVTIPESANRIRLDYVSQTGRGFSTVTGRIARGAPGMLDILKHLTLMLFTNNLLGSMVQVNLLPLIVFSIVFAGMLTTMGERSKLIADVVLSINDALMSFIMLLMRFAPIGIFCLVASRFGKAQADGKFLELLRTEGWYMLTVICGLSIHALVTLPLILWLCTRRNPYQFMGQMSQAFGQDLSFVNQMTITITATLAAIGAAGIPEAGLVTMLIVLNAVGLPLELVALIVPVDWLLDRFRTAVNAFGDSIGSAVVDPSFD